jgi:hypothetical protein
MDALCWYVSVSTMRKKILDENHWDSFFVSPKCGKRMSLTGFPNSSLKGIEFEVGGKYLFRQLTGLLIRQSCQACSSKPLARYYNKR